MTYYNRRQFLTRSTLGVTGAALGLSALSAQSAFAADTSGYKAIIGLMFYGGMDHNDTILPTDAPSYDALKAHRPDIFSDYNSESADSSRNRANLLQLNVAEPARFTGRTFGLPRELSGVADMFNAGDAAIIGNVGPLLEPATRDDFETGSALLPKRIFSHNDQQSTWMALGTEGTRLGWGGQFADAMIAADSTMDPLYAAITAGNPDVFLAGDRARAFQIPSVGSQLSFNAISKRWFLGYGDGPDAARAKLEAFVQRQDFGQSNLYRQDVIGESGRGISNQIEYSRRAAAATPFTTEFANNGLSKQLHSIAQSIALKGEIGVNRQVFYASMGGFDTHDGQPNSLAGRHAEINSAVSAFRDAMIEIGEWENVLVFTMSDFGRTIVGNGNGTDHGWGGHQFVMGGSVRGGRIYGDIPSPDLGDPQYTAQRGRLIPTTAVEQYAASIGQWFGLDSGELAQVFPNLARFDRSALSLT
jgi:uncharacterized protein (DUF1501 family)